MSKKKKEKEDDLKLYEVVIEARISAVYHIPAKSKKAAEKAMEDMEFSDIQKRDSEYLSLDVVSVEKVKFKSEKGG